MTHWTPGIPKELKTAAGLFERSGHQCWLVGGAVRDALLGRETDDYDLATSATPRQVMKIFHRTIPTGIKHGTVSILIGSHQFEVTTFRSDGSYSDKRHPDSISYAKDIQEDLSRRDFTINAIAWDLINSTMVDPYGGCTDIKKGIIKAIGNPEQRFSEDALRTIRACRFASELSFHISPETLRAIGHHLDGLQALSVERIWAELTKILRSPKPSTAFRLFHETGMLKIILPELENCAAVFNKHAGMETLLDHSLNACDAIQKDNLPLRAAALLHNIGKTGIQHSETHKQAQTHHVRAAELCETILRRYKSSNICKDRIVRLVRHHVFRYESQWSDAEIRRFITRSGLDIVDDLISLRAVSMSETDNTARLQENLTELKERVNSIRLKGDALTLKDLKVNGNMLINSLNMKPSPAVGEILDYLFDCVLDKPSLNEKEKLMEIACRRVSNYS